MPTKLSPLLCFVSLTILSACSFTRRSQTAHEQQSVSSQQPASSDLTFINDIAIEQGHNASIHNIEAYKSRGVDVAALPLPATDLQKEFAQFLELAPSKVIPDSRLWTFIDKWWGVPYRYGGTTQNGIDCSAFTQTLYSKVYQIATLPRTAQQQYDDSKKIKNIKDLKPGDLVFFRIHSRRISHVGVYLQNNKFVNASLSSGVTISDLTDRYWKRYFVSGGRPKETADNMMLISSK